MQWNYGEKFHINRLLELIVGFTDNLSIINWSYHFYMKLFVSRNFPLAGMETLIERGKIVLKKF